MPVSTHSRAEAAAPITKPKETELPMFQHTAARRRLQNSKKDLRLNARFNTQPRGGGCADYQTEGDRTTYVSTHSRAEAAAPYIKKQEKSAY